MFDNKSIYSNNKTNEIKCKLLYINVVILCVYEKETTVNDYLTSYLTIKLIK